MTGKFALAAMAALGAFASLPAIAQEKSAHTFTGNAALATDYIFRGISQTGEEPAVSAGFNYGHTSGIFLGVWGSNVDFNDGDQAHLEIDVFGGIRRDYRGATWELGLIHYAYPGATDNRSYDYDEVRLALGYDFTFVAATASVNYSPNYFADSGTGVYYALELKAPLRLAYSPSLIAGIGRQTIEKNARFGTRDYTDWRIGITVPVAGFDLSATYFDTSLNRTECANTENCDARGVLAISKAF